MTSFKNTFRFSLSMSDIDFTASDRLEMDAADFDNNNSSLEEIKKGYEAGDITAAISLGFRRYMGIDGP